MLIAIALYVSVTSSAHANRPLIHHCSAVLSAAEHTPSTDRAELKYYLTGLSLQQRGRIEPTTAADDPALDPHLDDVFAFTSGGGRVHDRAQTVDSVGRLVRLRDDLDRAPADVTSVAHLVRGREAVVTYLDRLFSAAAALDQVGNPAGTHVRLLDARTIGRSALGITAVVGGVVVVGSAELAIGIPVAGAMLWMASGCLHDPVGRCLDATIGGGTAIDVRRTQLDSAFRIVRAALTPDASSSLPLPVVHVGLSEMLDGRRIYIDHAFFAEFETGEPTMIGVARVLGRGAPPRRREPLDPRPRPTAHDYAVPNLPGLVAY